MAENTPNPYIAGNPITGGEMFFGREDVFDFIHQALTGKHQDNILVLYGQRRTGKTSVLYQMPKRLGERYLPVFIDLHGLALEGLSSFLLELANHIGRGLRRGYAIELPPIDRADFAADARNAFETTFLESVWEHIGDRQLLLMLDEAVRLEEQVRAGKLEPDIFDYLRHLMQHHARLNFLFSLGSGLEEMEKEYAFLFNVALYKKISFLDRSSAVDLITRPVEKIYTFEPDAVERILEVTSAHPYFTQLICHGLFNYSVSKTINPVTVADVNAVLDEAVERGLAVLKHVWEESSPAEKAVLSALASHGETFPHQRMAAADESTIKNAWFSLGEDIPRGEIASAVKRLIARDVIVASPMGGYRFTVELQRMWVQKYRRLDWTREEIKDWLGALPQIQAPPVTYKTIVIPWYRKPAILIPAFIVIACIGLSAILLSLYQDQLVGSLQSVLIPPTSPVLPASTSEGDSGGLSQEAQKVNSMAAGDGSVVAGTDAGLVVWDMDGNYFVASEDEIGLDCVNDILPLSDGKVWLACGGVSEVTRDENGNATYEFYDRDSGLGMGTVRRLVLDTDNTLWAGGVADPGGTALSHFEGDHWQNNDISAQAQLDAYGSDWDTILSMMTDSDTGFWLGSKNIARGGILHWDTDAYFQYVYSGEIPEGADTGARSLLQDRNGNFWVAAEGLGLLNLILDTGEFVPTELPNYDGDIFIIEELNDGNLWVGGDRYVARSTDGGYNWEQVGSEDGLGEEVLAIVEDDNRRIWAGAYNLGVSVLEDGAWKPLP
jgi:hypothetical protein